MRGRMNFRLPQCLGVVLKINRFQVRHYARNIIRDNVVNLDQQTLTGRLMSYLKSQQTDTHVKTENITKEAIHFLQKGSSKLGSLTTDKIVFLVNSLESHELVKGDKQFYRLLRIIDTECCSRQHNLQSKEIFNLLDAYMSLIPNRITDLKFYKLAMDRLFLLKEQLVGKEYMKFLFYVALMKKNEKSQKILRQTLSILKNDNINHLSLEELCIIANSTFKTSTRISNKNILTKMKNYLNDNLMLLKDPAIFVTLIKSLRQNRFCDQDLLSTISYAIFFNRSFEFYMFQTYCHILALYSDNLYYDDILLRFVTTKCVDELKADSENEIGCHKIRPKDVVRFLWGMSNLNCLYLERDQIHNIFVPKIIKYIQSCQIEANTIVDIFLYLWILNYKCYELVPYILDKRDALNTVPEKSKTRQRLNQLLTCIYHEDQHLFNKLDMRPQGITPLILSRHLKNRPCLENVLRSLQSFGFQLNIKFDVGYQIPHMNILGITGYHKNIYKTVNIEVLDNFTTLKNTESRPTGLMQMKLRILDGLEEALIVVKESEIEKLTEAELKELLLDELNLVC